MEAVLLKQYYCLYNLAIVNSLTTRKSDMSKTETVQPQIDS